MTVIRHNSISGIVSITAAAGSNLAFYDSTGSTLSLDTGDINAGVITATTANFTNATISGDLTVNGTTTTLDTTVTEVDRLEVGANNSTVGVAITQSGSGDILRLYDGASQVVTVKDGGNFGIGTDNPVSKLAIVGSSGDDARLEIKRTTSNVSGYVGAVNFTALDGHSVASVSALGDGDNEGAHLIFRTTSAAGENSPFGSNTFERLRIDSSGVVTIGTNGVTAGSNAKFEVKSTTGSINSATSRINGGGTTSGAINTGASLLFAGHDGVNGRDFASLFAGKENGTSGNHDAYLAFGTRVDGGSLTERLRIHSDGQIQAGTSSPTYLQYTGTSNPYNNNCFTLFGKSNIGLAGQYSTINWPSDHATADNTEPWYMMGRPHGTTDRWSFSVRPGSSNSLYNIIDCYNNADGSIESIRFGTDYGYERLRIDSGGNVGVNITPPSSVNSATKSIFINDRAAIVGWDGLLDDATSLTNNFYYNAAGSNIFIENGWANKLDLRDGTLRYSVSTVSGTAGGTASIQEKVRFLSGGGITFNGDTATANALDDYEEGSWTPSMTFGGGSTGLTGSFTGTYTKIGRLVMAQFQLTVTNKGSSTGSLAVNGLPFTIGTNYHNVSGFSYIHRLNMGQTGGQIFIGATGTTMWMRRAGYSGNDAVLLDNGDFTNFTNLWGGIVYHV